MKAFLLTLLILFSFFYYNCSKNEHSSDEKHENSENECGGIYTLLAHPFSKMFTFTERVMKNTSPIPGIPNCRNLRFAIGSVVTNSLNKDHVNYLLGDIQGVTDWETNPDFKRTWWDTLESTPALDFGGKLIAITNPGENDGWSTVYGLWRFVMIPLKQDGSFDIVPGGVSPTLDPAYIGFNIIAFV